jgi:hypothetical protein
MLPYPHISQTPHPTAAVTAPSGEERRHAAYHKGAERHDDPQAHVVAEPRHTNEQRKTDQKGRAAQHKHESAEGDIGCLRPRLPMPKTNRGPDRLESYAAQADPIAIYRQRTAVWVQSRFVGRVSLMSTTTPLAKEDWAPTQGDVVVSGQGSTHPSRSPTARRRPRRPVPPLTLRLRLQPVNNVGHLTNHGHRRSHLRHWASAASAHGDAASTCSERPHTPGHQIRAAD